MYPAGPAYVDQGVAFSRIPCNKEMLEELAKRFDAVVVLAERHELCYDLGFWEGRGVEVWFSPVEDFRAPGFVDLHRTVSWIAERAGSGRRVLIHCVGGLGRSGTVAAAYLMYRYSMDWREALARVREVRPGAVESEEQVSMLRAYSTALASTGSRVLDVAIEVGEQYKWGWGEGHASKVTQLTLRLWEGLSGPLGLDLRSAGLLTVAGLLHDIGRGNEKEGENHAEASARLILESQDLARVLEPGELEATACIARHHSREGSPLEDSSCPHDRQIALLAGILKIGDALDRSLDQSVLDVRASLDGGVIRVEALCPWGCRTGILRAEVKGWLLEQLFGRKITFIARTWF